MSKFTEQLKTLRVFNHYDFAGKDGAVFIDYSPYDRVSRTSSGWRVYKVGGQTNPNGAWYDYGNKVFLNWGRDDKAAKLAEAKVWTGETYGIKEWARTPFGSWMDAAFVARRMAELKARLAAGPDK